VSESVVYRGEPRFSEEGGQSVILRKPSANGIPEETMTATNKIDAIGWLRKQLELFRKGSGGARET
jgi:hypothetical protein